MKRSWLRTSLGMVAGIVAALAFAPAVFAEGSGGLLGGALAPVAGVLGAVAPDIVPPPAASTPGAAPGAPASVVTSSLGTAGALTAPLDGLLTAADPALDPLAPALAALTNPVADSADPIVAPIADAIAPLAAPLTGAVAKVAAPVTDAAAPAIDTVSAPLAAVTGPVSDAVAPAAGAIGDTVASLAAPVADAAGPLVSDVTSGAEPVVALVTPVEEAVVDAALPVADPESPAGAGRDETAPPTQGSETPGGSQPPADASSPPPTSDAADTNAAVAPAGTRDRAAFSVLPPAVTGPSSVGVEAVPSPSANGSSQPPTADAPPMPVLTDSSSPLAPSGRPLASRGDLAGVAHSSAHRADGATLNAEARAETGAAPGARSLPQGTSSSAHRPAPVGYPPLAGASSDGSFTVASGSSAGSAANCAAAFLLLSAMFALWHLAPGRRRPLTLSYCPPVPPG